jgi:hypothetical protein
METYSSVPFELTTPNIDLNDPKLKKISLRNLDLKQGLLFTHDKYYFFTDLKKEAPLLPKNGDSYNRLFLKD